MSTVIMIALLSLFSALSDKEFKDNGITFTAGILCAMALIIGIGVFGFKYLLMLVFSAFIRELVGLNKIK